MKVISFKICPFVQRVTALLEAKGLDYEVEFISLSEKPQWFLDISPHGQVPLLITETGAVLFESDAICEYLEEVFPPLQPGLAPEERAVNRAWSTLASKNYLVQCGAQRSPDAAALSERRRKLDTAFERMEERMEARLQETPFFGGETLGMVEIAWLPLLHRAAIIREKTGFDFLGRYPKLKAWQIHMLATGLAERSVSEDFEQVFSAFYLSDETFLGRGGKPAAEEAHQPARSGCCC